MEREGSTDRHAWLYQFNPADGASWLQDLASRRRVDWRIVNRAKATQPGDAVVFWESGDRGGLRGWGTVTDRPYPDPADASSAGSGRKQRWRVPVEAAHWLEEPFSRPQLEKSGALDGHLFMRMSQGASFPLEPAEYRRLLVLMGVDEDESHAMSSPLASHLAQAEEDPDEPEAPFDLPEGLLTTSLTTAAQTIVRHADYRHRGLGGDTTTTRLFLSLFEAVGQIDAPRGNPAEAAALRAMADVGREFQAPLQLMLEAYLARQNQGTPGGGGFTANASKLLQRAEASAFTHRAGGLLSADGLIFALFTTTEGSVLRHLEKAGLSLAILRDRFLKRVTEHLAAIRPMWRAAFGEESRPGGLTGVTGQVRLGNDNAWSQDITDSLGAQREADAFAALSTSSSFIPPLAVGVFGDWGAGKSFFMRLVHDRIQQLSEAAKADKDPDHLGDVVQIRFNAWHYVDSNLWASLVDHIFAELDKATAAVSVQAADKIFQQLTTARELTLASAEQLMARRREQSQAAHFVADAEARLAAKRAEVAAAPATYWNTALALVQTRIAQDPELRHQARLLGFEQAVDDVQQLGKAVAELDGVRVQSQRFLHGLVAELGSRRRMLVFITWAAALYGAGWLLHQPIVDALGHPPWAEWLKGWALAVSSAGAAAAGVVAQTSARLGRALVYLTGVRDQFRQAAREQEAHPAADVKRLQDELARLTAEVAEGQARFAASTEKVSDAAREYNEKNGRGRLLAFLRSRAAGDSYAKHLGLVSTVRKDFEELSDLIAESLQSGAGSDTAAAQAQAEFNQRAKALLTQAKDAQKSGVDLLHVHEQEQLSQSMTQETDRSDGPSVSRIVLYIDDLDRCQPEKVVEVLQAVHLLLSFRLFIVYVAVDVRWVSRALHQTYPSLLERAPGAGLATAHDYLEKIFQVPYWVRPMGVTGSTQFMADRLKLQKQARPLPEPLPPDAAPSAVPAPSADPAPTRAWAAPRAPVASPAPVASLARGAGSEAARDAGPTAAAGAPMPERRVQQVPRIDLTDAEVEFLTALASSAGNSPRRLIRFLNVYQVMKATRLSERGLVEGGGDEFDLMTQAAIVTGAPGLLDEWFELLKKTPVETTVGELLDKTSELGWDPGARKCLSGALTTLVSRRAWADAGGLQAFADLARRFSFGTAVQEHPLGGHPGAQALSSLNAPTA